MTRRRDLMCEDIFGCDHALTIPIADGGDVVEWRCVCGAKRGAPTLAVAAPGTCPGDRCRTCGGAMEPLTVTHCEAARTGTAPHAHLHCSNAACAASVLRGSPAECILYLDNDSIITRESKAS